jgi:hypothetical protein
VLKIEILLAPLAKLQLKQRLHANSLHSHEQSICKLWQRGQNLPSDKAEIAKAQWANATLKHLFKHDAVIDKGLEIKLIENTICVYRDGRLVIPNPLQVRAVMWYHHY